MNISFCGSISDEESYPFLFSSPSEESTEIPKPKKSVSWSSTNHVRIIRERTVTLTWKGNILASGSQPAHVDKALDADSFIYDLLFRYDAVDESKPRTRMEEWNVNSKVICGERINEMCDERLKKIYQQFVEQRKENLASRASTLQRKWDEYLKDLEWEMIARGL